MCSIFATKEEAKKWGKLHGQASPIRPLAENTLRRTARGVKRYVLDNPNPYLVQIAHGETGKNGSQRWGTGARSINDPLPTLTAKAEHSVVSPHLATMRNAEKPFNGVDEPAHTITAGGAGLGIVAPVIGGVGGRAGQSPERSVADPLQTITAKGDAAIMAPSLIPRYGEREGQEPRTRSIEEPFPTIVPDGNGAQVVAAHLSTYHGERGNEARGSGLDEPVDTIDAANRHAVVASFMGQYNEGFAKENSGDGHDLTDPLSTISTKGPHQAVVAGFLDQANGGFDNRTGRPVDEPISTILTQSRGHHGIAAAALVKLKGTSHDADPQDPLDTIAAGGMHHAVAATHIQRDFGQSVGSSTDDPLGTVTPGGQGKSALVAALMTKFYGQGIGQYMTEPLHTATSCDRFGLVTVTLTQRTIIHGPYGADFYEPGTYYIRDIFMRMLQPKELYAAQGFRPGYIFDKGDNGRILTKTEQVRMCGNSVCPPVAEALVRANCPDLIIRVAVPNKKAVLVA
jgi:DNA (cytosine-5)-methyltransferase 1